MNLVWHIAKKDLRRLAIPVGVWLAFILIPTIAFRLAAPEIEGHAASTIDMWRGFFSIWSRLLEAIQLVIAFVLAGTLVLEDPIVGTSSFWATRPIHGGQLLAAKLLAALLLLVATPILLLMPVWLASGFGARDLVVAAWDVAARFGVELLFALMTAALARNLAQFLFFSILIGGFFAATAILPAPIGRSIPQNAWLARESFVVVGALAAMGAILGHQFVTRRASRSWAIVGGALLAIVVIRCTWPTNFSGAATRLAPPRSDDHAADVSVDRTFTQHTRNSIPQLRGRTTWRPEGFAVPMSEWSRNGALSMRGSGGWAAQAGLYALGFKSPETPLRWELVRWPQGETEFDGLLETWVVRTRVLGEMPVRVGAELVAGSSRTRILQLVYHEPQLDNIIVEERDTQQHLAETWSRSRSPREMRGVTGRERFVDAYVLVNRARGIVAPATMNDLATMRMNSLGILYRDVGVAWRAEQRGEPTLVKVRFERERAFALPAQVHGVREVP